MARKAFFAAFIIDEDSYTPEPWPVDEHFVAADLAQSNFGEQPGVSHIVVWNSAADLIGAHRERGPITVDYLSREQPAHDVVTPPLDIASSFRDLLFPPMRDTLAFEYYEVRPCIERDRQVSSYADEGDYGADLKAAEESGAEFRTFWSLYGIDASAHIAIGDFVSKDAAHEVMNAILAIPAAARNALQGARSRLYNPPKARSAGLFHFSEHFARSSNNAGVPYVTPQRSGEFPMEPCFCSGYWVSWAGQAASSTA